MAVQFALLGFGPAGWAACAVITLVLIAGASGVFDQSDVDDIDYDEDGIYLPNPYVNPNPDEDNTHDPNPVVDPDIDGDGYEYAEPDTVKEEDKEKYGLPFSYVCVYMSQGEGDDYDPDIPDDIRPPSSSFTVAGEAYDSGIGLYIAAIMAFILTYWGVRNILGGRA